jgi:Mrp family chromosome partitioning ATPase
VHIVMVNWNTGAYLRQCLQSIALAASPEATTSRVTVVDNASFDDSAACSQAAAGGTADYLLFLNPDARLLQMIGAFFFVRRDLFVRLGGFDERYFLYFEEVSFALRARCQAVLSHFLKEVTVLHAGNLSSNQVRATRLCHHLPRLLLFAYRHWAAPQADHASTAHHRERFCVLRGQGVSATAHAPPGSHRLADRTPIFVFSGALASEGKRLVAANLGIAFAPAGHPVILVDADLRRAANVMGIAPGVRLADVPVEDVPVKRVVLNCCRDSLSLAVLASGPQPNPSELLSSPPFATPLDRRTSRADTVIVDTPALLPATDAAVVARRTAGVRFVAGARDTRRSRLVQAGELLHTGDARLLGVVVNRVPAWSRRGRCGAPDMDHYTARTPAARRGFRRAFRLGASVRQAEIGAHRWRPGRHRALD